MGTLNVMAKQHCSCLSFSSYLSAALAVRRIICRIGAIFLDRDRGVDEGGVERKKEVMMEAWLMMMKATIASNLSFVFISLPFFFPCLFIIDPLHYK